MSLNDIPDGAAVLLDANIVIYALRGVSAQCVRLLERCQARVIHGHISSVAVAEFCHRRMMQEAQSRGLIASNPSRALAQNRALLGQLSQYRQEVEDILAGELTVLELSGEGLTQALEIQRQYFLLTNDSLQIAAAKQAGIQHLASNDPQFDSVAGITRYAPSDLAGL